LPVRAHPAGQLRLAQPDGRIPAEQQGRRADPLEQRVRQGLCPGAWVPDAGFQRVPQPVPAHVAMVAPAALASRLLAAALCVAAAGMTAFAGAGPASGGPSPHRVITLSPHATEMIHAAGAGHTLVGTVSSSDFPDSARALPRVGDGILLNQERILTLRPTLVV